MNCDVVSYREVPQAEYSALLSACPDATVFHNLEWMPVYELFCRTAEQLLIVAREGSDLIAAMPVSVFRHLGAVAVFSSGFSAYGGVVLRRESDPAALGAVLKCFVKHFLTWRTLHAGVADFSGNCGLLKDYGLRESTVTTHVMKLPTDPNELAQSHRSPSNYRNRIRRIATADISIHRSKCPDDFRQWEKLCTRNYLAHGRRPYPAALYDSVARLICDTDSFRFHVAKQGSAVVGGTVHVCALKQSFYWMSATHPSFRAYHINAALTDLVLRELISEGYSRYDFGASPPNAEGLATFKERSGGVKRTYSIYEKTTPLGSLAMRVIRGQYSLPCFAGRVVDNVVRGRTKWWCET